MLDVIIRPEERADAPATRAVIVAAFEDQPYSNHRQHHIVDKLYENSPLTVSLVAVRDAAVVGHIAFSPVTIDGKFCAWYGLGPLSVTPIHQRKGVGSRLVNTGPKLPEARSANGCVLLGEPNFYSRFGFVLLKVSVSPDSLRNLFWPGRSCLTTCVAKLSITSLSARSSFA